MGRSRKHDTVKNWPRPHSQERREWQEIVKEIVKVRPPKNARSGAPLPEMSGANASPLGRSHQEMSGANARPLARISHHSRKENGDKPRTTRITRMRKLGST